MSTVTLSTSHEDPRARMNQPEAKNPSASTEPWSDVVEEISPSLAIANLATELVRSQSQVQSYGTRLLRSMEENSKLTSKIHSLEGKLALANHEIETLKRQSELDKKHIESLREMIRKQ